MKDEMGNLIFWRLAVAISHRQIIFLPTVGVIKAIDGYRIAAMWLVFQASFLVRRKV
jgi:hypothetical protein